MTASAADISDLLRLSGWQGAKRDKLNADFSSRTFSRLTSIDGSRTAILMQTDKDDKTDNFISIAKLLRGLQISVPEIYGVNRPRTLVLMEDFGDKNCGRAVDGGSEDKAYYRTAVDLLIHLHQAFDMKGDALKAYPSFDKDLFARQAQLFLNAYVPFVQAREIDDKARMDFEAACKDMLGVVDGIPTSFLLRDFMLDNLMELKGRPRWRRLGVLDFQDGGIGPIAYDLISLLEVARRQGGDLHWDELIRYYWAKAKPNCDAVAFNRCCKALSLQRHLRILGLIANYTRRTQRRDKLAYLPRIKHHIRDLLANEATTPIRLWFEAYDVMENGLV